ncbi:MAG: adenylate/guanylate cyclase domain-containing protein [Spirochaetaceae bacterium]|nr:MAG: adenylate/guanylate cyclase domain-containing protein [Spirochaetaceae bacterium]
MIKSTIFRGAVVGAITALVALGLWFTGVFDGFEAGTWDMRARFFAPYRDADPDVVLVLLDQASLDWARDAMGVTWPWPRELYAAIVGFLTRAEARVVAFDVLYLDPSPFAGDDEAFGNAILANGRFVGSAFFGTETGDAVQWPADVPVPAIEITSERDTELSIRRYERASFPIPEVAENSRYIANVESSADGDGVFRRAAPVAYFDARLVPSFGLAAYLAARPVGPGETDAAGVSIEYSRGRLVLDGRVIPTDSSGRVVLQFKNESGHHEAFAAAAVLQSEIQLMSDEEPVIRPEEFRDKYVLFGFSAPGLFDLRSTPIASLVPGVDVHATFLENLLTDGFMRELPRPAGAAFIALLVFLAAVIGSVVTRAARTVVVYVLLIPVPIVIAFAGYAGGYWVPLVLPTVGVALALVGANVMNYATEGRQKRYIKNAFQQYLSPAVIEQLIQNPDRLRLGGERRELSIFFSDLEGFTSLSEGLSPEDLTALLNEYLSAMTEIIQEEGGTVDKYEGDAIIAFWNAPLPLDDHALRCARAALRCQEKLAEMRPGFAARVGKDLRMRIGINTGPAVVGNMGSRTRFDYTMLGDAVNLAARLEGINKQFGTYTMISGATYEKVRDEFPARELSRVAVVGRAEPVVVYEPFFPGAHAGKTDQLRAFHEALLAYYRGDFAAAAELFAALAASDPPAQKYVTRCRELAENPPDEWSGVWSMTSK